MSNNLKNWNFKKNLLIIILLFSSLYGDELTVDPPEIWPAICCPCRPPDMPPPCGPEDVLVDLVDPAYSDGVLTTESGGVLTAQGLRIQAQNITYVRKLSGEVPIFTVNCEGNLLVDYGNRILVGDRLYYDFTLRKGFLIQGRTASPPWYVGGAEMLLMEDGNVIVIDGFITTSEGEIPDVALRSPYISLTPERILMAQDIQFRVNTIPLFWLPRLQLDLKNIERPPFGVKCGWGGFLGSYISILYRFLSWGDFKATARIDGFFGKGIGGGIETVFNPSWRPTQWYSRNYYAHDIRLDDRHRKDRYRFQGTFYDRAYGVVIDGMYDFVSDGQMAAEYNTRDFDLKSAGRTQINFLHKDYNWIANLFTEIRVNRFQTVSQELPSLRLNWHPFEIPSTGILCENTFKASYYRYKISDAVIEEDPNFKHNFDSSRIAIHPFLYRPFLFGPFILTPEAGFIGIAYSNSPGGKSAGQAVGECGIKLETVFSKGWQTWKHTLEPYLHHNFLTTPRVAADNHFIFSIRDGVDRLNMTRFGIRNSFFRKIPCGLERTLWIDLWANAFFNTPTIHRTIPRGYIDIEWMPHQRVLCSLRSAWNFWEHQFDFYNIRLDCTWNTYTAFGVEYRHRGRFDWLKADFYNFILESVRTQEQLLAASLSDKRDTLLFRIFTRINPDWTAQIDLRSGWNRKDQPSYLEYQIEMTRVVFQHWRLGLKYEKRESDNRFSLSLLLAPGPPLRAKYCIVE